MPYYKNALCNLLRWAFDFRFTVRDILISLIILGLVFVPAQEWRVPYGEVIASLRSLALLATVKPSPDRLEVKSLKNFHVLIHTCIDAIEVRQPFCIDRGPEMAIGMGEGEMKVLQLVGLAVWPAIKRSRGREFCSHQLYCVIIQPVATVGLHGRGFAIFGWLVRVLLYEAAAITIAM